jgi:succinate-semialdehyde dehydrogenase / glutarate-semialdehyde dehydrogenase
MQIRNPRTGLYDCEIHCADYDEVAEICNKAKAHQIHWANQPIADRIAALQLWKHAIIREKETLLQQLAVDTGRWSESVLEVDLVAASIDRWCSIAADFLNPFAEKDSSIPFIKLQQDLVPYAVVGVISPWNFPILLSLIDTIPALLAGCSVIVKPSEVTPRFISVLQKSIDRVPALKNILHYITGDGATGASLVQQCDLICFTGSTATGKKVYAAAAARMIPVFLELGGKDAAIVMDDVDIERTAASILYGSTVNAGQSCLSIERVYVHETIYQKFINAIISKAKAISLNADEIKNGQIGPIIFEKQKEIIDSQLADAVAKGAVIEYGNAACANINGGWYCLPTILSHVHHEMLLMQEETFGPIIPVMPFKDEEEAIFLANDSKYGLSGAVFCKEEEIAKRIAQRLVAGAISINDCALTAIMHEGEKNSFKQSGIGGTRMGPSAIKRFMRQKVYIHNTLKEHSPWWFK